MATGQPQILNVLEFGVTDLQLDDQTVHEGDSFNITVDFEGKGWIWAFLEWISDNIGILNATTNFYAEGMGAGAQEFDLGSTATPLASGAAYSATLTVNTSAATTLLLEGVYRIQCLVQVEGSAIMGYYPDDLLLSVYD